MFHILLYPQNIRNSVLVNFSTLVDCVSYMPLSLSLCALSFSRTLSSPSFSSDSLLSHPNFAFYSVFLPKFNSVGFFTIRGHSTPIFQYWKISVVELLLISFGKTRVLLELWFPLPLSIYFDGWSWTKSLFLSTISEWREGKITSEAEEREEWMSTGQRKSV